MRFGGNIITKLSSDTKSVILRHILGRGFRMTGRELARVCGISHSMAIDSLKEFEEINLVRSFRAGRSVVWTANPDSYAYLVADRLYGTRENYMPLEHLKTYLKKNLPGKIVKRAVLFGSVARGEEKAFSDIDLFVLAANSGDKVKIGKILDDISAGCVKLYGNPLGYYVLSEAEYRAKKKLPLVKNIEEGIVLV